MPRTPARGLSGRHWPYAQEVAVGEWRDADIDLVVLQRPQELELAELWLGRRPGIDLPAVYVEHNAPRPSPVDSVRADVHTLAQTLQDLEADHSAATLARKAAREYATPRSALDRFPAQWDEVIEERCA